MILERAAWGIPEEYAVLAQLLLLMFVFGLLATGAAALISRYRRMIPKKKEKL